MVAHPGASLSTTRTARPSTRNSAGRSTGSYWWLEVARAQQDDSTDVKRCTLASMLRVWPGPRPGSDSHANASAAVRSANVRERFRDMRDLLVQGLRPNGSRLSCGRRARGRKELELQTKEASQRGNAILPYL